MQIKEVMLDSANETIIQLKNTTAEAEEEAAEALDRLRQADARLKDLNPGELDSLRSFLPNISCLFS